MPDAHYTLPVPVAIYDVDSPWSQDRDDYVALAGQAPRTIVEIGCGTGLVAEAIARLGECLYCDWTGGADEPQQSEEIIVQARAV